MIGGCQTFNAGMRATFLAISRTVSVPLGSQSERRMENLDNQKHYWDRVGPTKSFSHPVNVRRLATLLDRQSRILDFGCGYGRALGALYHHGYRNVIGVDPAPGMVA